MTFRYIMEQSKDINFEKRSLELGIFKWMPFKQVREL